MIDAIVMAAGVGSRLRPLTGRWAKPVLPVDGRPVLATLLGELAAAGIDRVALVTGHLAGQVERLAGDGSAWGLRVAFVRQPEADGSADAVRRALEARAAAPPALVVAADTVFAPGDLRRFIDAWAASGADSALAVQRTGPHERGVEARGGRILRIRAAGSTRLRPAPLWVAGPEAASRLCRDAKPWELAHAVQLAIDEGAAAAAVEIGPTRDLTHPEDLVAENFDYVRGL